MSKPDARVFLHVARGARRARPSEAAHVGDIQRTDIAGAQAAGMAAVHFVGANNADVTALHRRRHRQPLRRAAAGARRPHLCRLLTTWPASSRQRRRFLIAAAAGLAVVPARGRPHAHRRAGRARRQDRQFLRRPPAAAVHRASPGRWTCSTPGGCSPSSSPRFLGGLWWSGRMVQAVYLGASVAVALIINPLLKLAFERQRPTTRRARHRVQRRLPERPHDDRPPR